MNTVFQNRRIHTVLPVYRFIEYDRSGGFLDSLGFTGCRRCFISTRNVRFDRLYRTGTKIRFSIGPKIAVSVIKGQPHLGNAVLIPGDAANHCSAPNCNSDLRTCHLHRSLAAGYLENRAVYLSEIACRIFGIGFKQVGTVLQTIQRQRDTERCITGKLLPTTAIKPPVNLGDGIAIGHQSGNIGGSANNRLIHRCLNIGLRFVGHRIESRLWYLLTHVSGSVDGPHPECLGQRIVPGQIQIHGIER